MRNLSRRHFLAASGIGLAAALHAEPLGIPLGCQTFPVRETIGTDLNGTLRKLAAMGYKRIEMCSPPGYVKYGFGSLMSMKASELRDAIGSAGLDCESCHYQFSELKENLDERIAYAKGLGLRQMVLSTFGSMATATLSDWSQAAETLNKIGEKTLKAGLPLGFHNHNFEFKQIDGVLVYDHLMKEFDPKYVKSQFQVDVISMGYDATTYLTKYPGHFLSMHLQDWSPETKKDVALGKGIVDWPKVFAAAKKAEVKNYFVELNPELMGESAEYLRGLKG
jgi:sugar phosphate isomerase/epimerase